MLVFVYLVMLAGVVRYFPRGPGPAGLAAEPVEPAPPEMVLVDTLQYGDTLDEIFRQRGFTHPELLEIVRASKEHYNLNRVHPGAVFSVEMQPDGSIGAFSCTVGETRRLVVEREEGGYHSSLVEIPYEYRERCVAGVIESSLYETVSDLDEDPMLCVALSEIFAWQVDFNTDLRSGDEFRTIIVEHVYEGKQPIIMKIAAARMVNRGKVITAIRYEDPSGHVDYYEPDGKSVRRKFLKSPLRYTRVSSGFSHRRFHPILKYYRPHLGIDYAAPTGTPVVSVGDGTVTFAGRNGGYGHFVKIRHNSVYQTTYGHLSRYGKGIRKGATVRQGQIIGYVGATGLATGPHLDYRLIRNGRFVNPFTVDLPAAEPIGKKHMDAFRDHARPLIEQLDSPVSGIILTRSVGEDGDDDG